MSLLSYVATYAAGAGSTLVGSWAASKIRIYHETRSSHLDDLKSQILQPLLGFLQSQGAGPVISVEWGLRRYNAKAEAQEQPAEAGPALSVSDFAFGLYEGLDDALLEDSRQHHFRDLLSGFEEFRKLWVAHAFARRDWVEEMGEKILEASGLPAFKGGVQHPYVMHLHIANFVYSRLMHDSPLTMAVAENPPPPCLNIDNMQRVAASDSVGKVREVLALVNGLLKSGRQRASKLQSEAEQLQSRRSSLARQFSLALASKRLPHFCSLVTFR